MRRLLIATMSGCMLAGSVAVAAPPATAGPEPVARATSAMRASSVPKAWMTRKEYRKLKKGMTIEKVRKIVGSKGRLYYAHDSSAETVAQFGGPLKVRCYYWRTPRSKKGASIRFFDGKIYEKVFTDSPHFYYLT